MRMEEAKSTGSPSAVKGVSRDQFAKVPYIDHVPTDGRTVFLAPYLDRSDNRWKVHVPQLRGLGWIFAEPVESCYYAESIADRSNDIYIELMDAIAQHYSFDSVLRTSLELVRRIVNCTVVLEKYFLWLTLFRKTKKLLVANLVQTDLEYLVGNARIAYDLMQTILCELWIKTHRPKLKSSFAGMAQMNPSDLRDKYGLPPSSDLLVSPPNMRSSTFSRVLRLLTMSLSITVALLTASLRSDSY